MVEEPQINQNFIELFRELIRVNFGINISKDKDYLIQNKLTRLLKKSNYKSITELYYSLKQNDQKSLEELVRYITTTHTFFYREKNHLTILRKDILIRRIYKPMIWCAACSTGEEVYSIIIELLENNITDFSIIATDINQDVLIHLKKGIYSKERMREMDNHLVRKYFDKLELIDKSKDDYFQVKKYLKNYFIVKKINLIKDLKFEKKFDYIFCRNVLIYFDLQTQRLVINNLINNLNNLGYLFVGHSESLLNVTNKLEAVFSSVYNIKM